MTADRDPSAPNPESSPELDADPSLGPAAQGGSDPDDENELRALLRGALTRDEPEPPNVLDGVQRKLRQRSRGKFFGDRWSTSEAPIATYLVTSIMMLIILAATWAVLRPLASEPAPVNPVAPINVVPHRGAR
jgi:hypothetical protein